eukprot:Partr_v1_DN28487_c0_g3_i1_m42055 putative breakpoint cluster region
MATEDRYTSATGEKMTAELEKMQQTIDKQKHAISELQSENTRLNEEMKQLFSQSYVKDKSLSPAVKNRASHSINPTSPLAKASFTLDDLKDDIDANETENLDPLTDGALLMPSPLQQFKFPAPPLASPNIGQNMSTGRRSVKTPSKKAEEARDIQFPTPPPPIRASSVDDDVDKISERPDSRFALNGLRADMVTAMSTAFEADETADVEQRSETPQTQETVPLSDVTAAGHVESAVNQTIQQPAQSPKLTVNDRVNILAAEIQNIRIGVPGSSILLNKEGKEYLVYNISIHLVNPTTSQIMNLWRLQKRYSDFLEMSEQFRQHLTPEIMARIGSIPASVFADTGVLPPCKTDQRRMILMSYLCAALSIISDPSEQVNNPTAPAGINTILRFLGSDILEVSSKRVFNSIIEGYLTKKGRILGRWKRRYFVLIHDQLVYWSNKEKAYHCAQAMKEMPQPGPNISWPSNFAPQGVLPLQGSKISKQRGLAPDVVPKSSEYIHAFMISQQGGDVRRSVLCGQSDMERDEWVYHLVRQVDKVRNGELKVNDSLDILLTEQPPAPGKQVMQKESPSPVVRNGKDKSKLWSRLSSQELSAAPINVETEQRVQPVGVFGAPLQFVVEMSRRKNGHDIPAVFFRCIEYLEAKGAYDEIGIYRQSGSQTEIQRLVDRFNKHHDIELTSEYHDNHVIAGLLKRYLRELPESIFTERLHRSFLHVTDLLDKSDRVIELARLVSLLPLENYTVLRALMSHFLHIVQHSELNRMNARNLGIVFAPTLGAPAGLFSLMMSEFEFIFWVTSANVIDEYTHPDQTDERTKRKSTMLLKSHQRPRNSLIFEKNAPTFIKQTEMLVISEDQSNERSSPEALDDFAVDHMQSNGKPTEYLKHSQMDVEVFEDESSDYEDDEDDC